MKQQVNIYDIAEMTGVSPSTVSNVINGKTDKVSKVTKQKVLDCLKKTGYRTNMLARNLVMGKSLLIGVCLPLLEIGATKSDLLENNPFYHEFIDGAERVLSEHGYECVVCGADDNFKYLEWIQQRCLDGIIDLGALSESHYQQLSDLKIPTVLVDNYNSFNANCDVIVNDDVYGAYVATRHLIELGHKKIGFICSGVASDSVDTERYKGFKKALDEYGITDIYVYKTVMDYSYGKTFGHRIVDENLPISAVLCAADIAAIGIMHGLSERGKSVPNDFSVVGYDDIKLLQYVTPQLTTVRQNTFAKGSLCANILLDKINNPQTHINKKTVLECELIIRNSTRRKQ